MANFSLILIFSLLLSFTSTAPTVKPITDTVSDDSNYNYATFQVTTDDENYYFQYSFSTIPTSRIGAFRFDFIKFDSALTPQSQVLCTFVESSASDSDLINALNKVTKDTSICIGAFGTGLYDGIFEYDKSKKKLGILFKTTGEIESEVSIYIRNKDTALPVEEKNVNEHSKYSLIPFTITISDFRSKASKILFFSRTRDMQMYYVEEDKPYPERLFFGNIMSVYTNPDMVRMKYKNANTMILLTRPFDMDEPMGEQFLFQVRFFASDYLLDYYMGTNPLGREKNTPLAINMTVCKEPYYVIVNYNKPEGKTSLFIDQIYGKIKYISVAQAFKRNTWEDMIQNDLESINITQKKFEFKKDSKIHMDVYKIECDAPLLLNFYYVDESAKIPELNYGQVVITTLKARSLVSLPFNSDVRSPQLTIEVFNPTKDPFVIVNDGVSDEFIISKNSLVKTSPMNTGNPLVIKERGGDKDTRIIVKVGYKIVASADWETISDNVKYNKNENLYVFYFPSNVYRYNYTYALLETSGTNTENNVKYCYATNIGSAILPSSDNCYRVSDSDKYTIKFMNPDVMYKDYVLDDSLIYYVSLKPINKDDKFTIKDNLVKYDVDNRNLEAQANVIKLSSTIGGTILSYPKDDDESVFYQITPCSGNKITYSIKNAYDSTEIVPDTDIAQGTKNYFSKFGNIFGETKLKFTGTNGDKIFVKYNGVTKSYSPTIRSSFKLSFDKEKNAIIFPRPLDNSESFTYTVYVAKEGDLSKQSLTICSFVVPDITAPYSKTFSTYTDGYSLPINFKKIGLKKGQKFEAIAYAEQDRFNQMSFMSDLLTDTVGEIKEETIIKIETPKDNDYVHSYQAAKTESTTYYFSFKNPNVFDVPVGAIRIQLDDNAEGSFKTIQCAWVEDGADAMTMVEAVEEAALNYKSYCLGGEYKMNKKKYNYIFKYEYTSDNKPKRLVIKVPEVDKNSGFDIIVRQGNNVEIKQTDFYTQQEYGNKEDYESTYIPYILDLKKIRGDDTVPDYVSKILIYSKFLEMQMYYIDKDSNTPVKLFSGNVMLVLTKPKLAEQKYFGTKLILLSEYIRGQEHSQLGNSFRFHTKMFRSTDQIEYYVSNNVQGRTKNFPLSLEINTCTSSNNVYYYILNYNKEEEETNLYLDLIFGSIKKARIVTELSEDNWDKLIKDKMEDIKDYFAKIPQRSQHIDIVEIQCNTPLLANIFYNHENTEYSWVSLGDVAIKNLSPKENFAFQLDTASSGSLFYSIEVYDPTENPNINMKFSGGASFTIKENSLSSGILFRVSDSVNIINNGNSNTRIIFKVGFGVENDWTKEQGYEIEGTLYSKEGDNRFVYKFPTGAKNRNYTNVEIHVKPMKKGSEPILENLKFCYSTSLGMPIKSSEENCFRTGVNIPYTLTLVNPFISPKDYKSYTENYYITLTPKTSDYYLDLKFTENKYDTKDRNIEGAGKIIKIDSGEKTKSTILSIPELVDNNKIIVQLQVCVSGQQMVSYVNYNAYTSDVISTGNVSKAEKLHFYEINNNLMETKLELTGAEKDQIFVKHTGVSSYSIRYENYAATFNQKTNEVSIIKPIFNEEFTINILIGKRGAFKDFTLCTFTDISADKFQNLADYVRSFSSVSSNEIIHYIDFRTCKGNYSQGVEFDLLVYAVQSKNSKLEFLYNVIEGVVGEIKAIFTPIEGVLQENLIVTQEFKKNLTNYFYYDFTKTPVGNAASLKIVNEGDSSVTVSKVICTFVKEKMEDKDMITEINDVAQKGTNLCKGDEKKDSHGFNALINANDIVKNNLKRILIMVQYGFGEDGYKKELDNDLKDDAPSLRINLRVTGVDVSESDKKYNENEDSALVPYVLDLNKIRGTSQTDYISKVLIYSMKRELEMFHLQGNAPTQLFTGNILLVYTNSEVIKEKYQGASTMILLTESLFKNKETIIGENFRFKTYFFKSDNTMQYYVSSNPHGRPMNIPTTMELTSCDKPYYYILNYHVPTDKDLTLHIDQIYGEMSTKRIITKLEGKEDWYDLINSMEEFTEDEFIIKDVKNYHIDVIEATCIIPSLLHIYYTDDSDPEIKGIAPGDTSIINLGPSDSKEIKLQSGAIDYSLQIFTFEVLLEDKEPHIGISFSSGDDSIEAIKNGVYILKTIKNMDTIYIKNEEIGGSSKTRIIFKFGYEIENEFEPIDNQLYHSNKTENLFGYKFKTEDDWLNYTSVSFLVSTTESNVKFCYSTSFGAFMEPSLQDCYRVGRSNTYTLNILNPYLMFKDYITSGDEIMKYYVGFKTVERGQNITITPSYNKYKTKYRNLENIPSSIKVTTSESTILSFPNENTPYIFLQLQVCDTSKIVDVNFFNAYNNTQLNYRDSIDSDIKTNYLLIDNIKMDTELKMTISGSTKMFIRHIGISEEYYPYVEDIKLNFNRENNTLKFNQPILNEEFSYYIYYDEKNKIKEQNYNLCSYAENTKLSDHLQIIESSAEEIEITIDFDKNFKDVKEFDIMVLARQINNGKLIITSDVLQIKANIEPETKSNTELIIIIVVLTVILVCGGIIIFICLKRYKNQPNSKKLDAKQTTLDMVDNANEKMIMSTATEKND